MSGPTTATLGAYPRRAVRPRMQMFVPATRVRRIATVAAFVGFVLLPAYAGFSLWLGVGLALSVFVAWHAVEASREIPWIPGLTMISACVQWILAPWVVYVLEGNMPFSLMPVAAAEYFGFAVPATLALVLGILLPLRRHGRRLYPRPTITLNSRFRYACEAMVVLGLLARLFLVPLTPRSLRFAAYLVAGLSTVGVCGLLLSNSPGWYWRAAAVVGIEGFFNTLDAQFLDVMLLVGFMAVLFVYRYQVKARTIVGLIIMAMVALLAINALKRVYRIAIWADQVNREERLGTASDIASGIASSPGDIFSSDNLLYNLARLNQGGVIGRVMAWVPSREPYANGETITVAVRSALVPRLFDPNKARAGGFDNYKRFTGYDLVGATSINLGIAGEMYANFGQWGGVAAVGLYGIAFGWLFALLARWATRSALWWAWAPFIFYSTVSAEMGTNEVLNQVSKALVVVFVVARLVPAWNAIRKSQRRVPLGARSPVSSPITSSTIHPRTD